MSDSVYNVIVLVGRSKTSWEDAARNAVERAGKTLRDLRVAEVKEMDIQIEDGKIVAYRTKVTVSFRVEAEEELYYHKDPNAWMGEKERHSCDG